MPKAMPDVSSSYNLVASADRAIGIQFIGRIDHHLAAALIKALKREISTHHPIKVTVDLNRISYFDDFGVLVLSELRNFLDARSIPFHLIQPPPKAGELLALFNFDSPDACPPVQPKLRENPIVRLGEGVIHQLYHMRFLVSFLGSAAICMLHVVRHPGKFRINDTLVLIQKTGVDAVPIVGLISFLLGLIMAFVSSIQLEQFGASIYVASLVALAMVSELGPIMTAMVVAGRSGSAFAAEIGTMRISDEVDALFTMGISPALFLVVPRILAAVMVVPVLTLFADLLAIFGGLVISVSMLDLTISTYISQTIKSLDLFEFCWGLMKSVVFAALIAWIGLFRALYADTISKQLTSALKKINRTIDDAKLSELVNDFRTTAQKMQRLIGADKADKMDGLLASIQRQVLVTLNRIERAADTLNRLLDQLANQPSQVIFSAPAVDKP